MKTHFWVQQERNIWLCVLKSLEQKWNWFFHSYCKIWLSQHSYYYEHKLNRSWFAVVLVPQIRALLMLDCENLVRMTNLCLITQQISNNKSAGIYVMFLSCRRGICHSVFLHPSITAFSMSQSFILHTFSPGLIYQHIMLHLHISPLWS